MFERVGVVTESVVIGRDGASISHVVGGEDVGLGRWMGESEGGVSADSDADYRYIMAVPLVAKLFTTADRGNKSDCLPGLCLYK
jgi:hypothetical protein